MSRADGTLTRDEIMTVSPLDESETLRTLYGLIASGVLSAPGIDIPGEIPSLQSLAGPPQASTPVHAPRPSDDPSPPGTRVSDLEAFLKRTTTPAVAPPHAAAPRAAAHAGGRPTPPSAAELAGRRAELQARLAACDGATHFAVLGVERTADEGAIRRAYYKLAREFHPDKHRGPGVEDLLPQIEAMFAKTTEAYNTLTDEKARAEYEHHLVEIESGARPPDADIPAQARDSYLRARKHLDAGELYDALRLFETACHLDPTKPDYWLYLGMVQTRNPKWRRKAEASLLKAIEMNQSAAAAYLHLARLYKAGGLVRKSHDLYEKLLQWDPTNDEALEELGRSPTLGKGAKKPEDGSASRLKSLFKGTKS
jgi:tetratricopeptide (TPR) repeat protein